jgi:2-oxoglutarate dehydrogenase complex dehydrogenase (E1) component-like enzyme
LRLTRVRGSELRHIARRASASPASGSIRVHEREQSELIDAALRVGES